MTFDDDLRQSFDHRKPLASELEAAALAAISSSNRRTVVGRVVRAGALCLFVAVGALGLFSLRDSTSEIETVTPAPDTTQPPPVTTETGPSPGTSTPREITVGLVTVDLDGIVRINNTVIDTEIAGRPGVAPEEITVTDANGADGVLVFETDAGIFTNGALWHKAPDAQLHDVSASATGERLTLISWEVPAGNDPSGQVLGVSGSASADDFSPYFAVDGVLDGASFGPDGQILMTWAKDECTRLRVTDWSGELIEANQINKLSRCLPGEIAAWSSAGHVVFARPTQEDSWTVQVIGVDGSSAEHTIAGAFQPQHIDVTTSPGGDTSAVILGTGEELVLIDVDSFLEAEQPDEGVVGLSNDQNLVSARLVSGLEDHGYLSERDTPTTTPVPEQQSASVWNVVGVESNDTLNARSGPGANFDRLFEFAHDATGVVRTGPDAVADDGGIWFEVYTPTSGTGVDVAWVSSAFLEETSVLDARPCMFNGPQDHYIGIDWTNSEGSANAEAVFVSNIDTYRFGGCIRTVFEFTNGWVFDEETTPATMLPNDIVVTRDTPPTIDFGTSITSADFDAVSERFSEAAMSASVFASLGPDNQLDGVLYGPTTVIWVVFDNTTGRMIIDVADIRLPADADPALIDRIGVGLEPVVNDENLVITSVASGNSGRSWTIDGLARPFENQMGVAMRDLDDQPLNVVWAGTPFRGESPDNVVMPTTWTEALGQFSFTITLPDGVDPADVRIEFDVSSPPDDTRVITLALADFAN